MEDDKELLRSVLIDLEPTNCSMRMSRTLDPEKTAPDSLSMNVKLPWRADVRTPDDRSLKGAEWSITLYDGGTGSELTRQHNAIGQLNYLAPMEPGIDDDGFPESCDAWATLDSQTFGLLRGMALSGKLPAGFRLHTHGLTYGWEPDGSGKVWDINARPHAFISDIEIISNLVVPPEREQSETEVDEFWIEPKPQPESPELIAARATTKAIEAIDSRLLWIFVLLAFIAAVVAFRQ